MDVESQKVDTYVPFEKKNKVHEFIKRSKLEKKVRRYLRENETGPDEVVIIASWIIEMADEGLDELSQLIDLHGVQQGILASSKLNTEVTNALPYE